MKEKVLLQDGVSDENLEFSRKWKVISVYARSTGSNVQAFDECLNPLEVSVGLSIERNICRHCTVANHDGDDCRKVHADQIRESGRHGRPQIYRCGLGLMFWVSPIYGDGRFSGALRGSGYISPECDGDYGAFCNGTISTEEFIRRVSSFPVGDAERIQSLAEMLLLCSESLSTGSVNHHEMLRLRSERQASLSVLVGELKEKHPDGSVLPGYPLDKERDLLTSLRQGNKEEAEKILNEILAILVFSNQDHFHYIQARAMELAVLLTRTGTNAPGTSVMESNARYLRHIQEAQTVEDLTGILHGIVESVIEQIVSFQGIPHASAMRKAELYIRENLTRKISLGEIAKVAGLSAPYFSTIFKEEMGENLSGYVNRQRVEKASKLLLETNLTLSEIATSCCFQDQSWFSKIFKSFTGISPGKYRRQGGQVAVLRSNVGRSE